MLQRTAIIMNLFDYLRGGCEYSIAITKKNDVDARLLLHCIERISIAVDQSDKTRFPTNATGQNTTTTPDRIRKKTCFPLLQGPSCHIYPYFFTHHIRPRLLYTPVTVLEEKRSHSIFKLSLYPPPKKKNKKRRGRGS